MAQSGPIVIVEDDLDDQEMMQEVLTEIGITNKLIFFSRCLPALVYLKTTEDQPFLIISDVNLPQQNGIEFKRQIDDDPQLREKSIPFVFFSTSIDRGAVNVAYKEITVQGFFQKKSNYQQVKSVLKLITDYWIECRHPNS